MNSLRFLCIFALVAAGTCPLVSAAAQFIPCPLQWTPLTFGDALPEKSVPVSTTTDTTIQELNYIARTRLENGDYAAGRMEKGVAYITDGSQGFQNEGYEILTNPHGCQIAWSTDQKSPYVVQYSPDSNVGRSAQIWVGIINVRHVYPGPVESNHILYTDATGRVSEAELNQVLTSYVNGLSLRLLDFKFKQNLFSPYKEFLGVDEILNMADTRVKQSVTHKKRTKQSFKLETHKSWGHVFGVTLGFKPEFSNGDTTYSGPDISFNYSFPIMNEESKKIESMSEVEIVVTREVEVPAYTSISVCSTVNLVENFELDYTCRGRYSAVGLNSSDIATILARDGISGTPEGDAVMVDMSGKLSGGMALATQFIVLPLDDPDGCTRIAGKIAQFKNLMRDGKLKIEDWNGRQEEINQMIQRPRNASNVT